MESLLIQHSTAVIAFVAVAAGLSVALCAWLLSGALAEVPPEDREYKDPPPLGFRLLWWPIHWIAYFIGPLVPARRHMLLQARLRKAGLEYALSAGQFMAARLVSGVVGAMLLRWGLASLEHALEGRLHVGATGQLWTCAIGFLIGMLFPGIWLNDLLKRRTSELLKSLPFYLDIITLCVEAGLNLQGALQQAVAKGPRGVLRDEIQRVLRDMRAGKARAEALRTMADRLNEPNVSHFITAVIQAERMGMNLGPVLRAQADQRRAERFQRAEKLAMEAPVKMLFPLLVFIFPCTFVVLFFPIAMKLLHPGT
jgi:tight adherence protein C